MSSSAVAATRPWVESEALEAHLDAIGADEETRRFAGALSETGVARVDLGPEGRDLCDRVVLDTDPYFDRPGVDRVQDAWLRSRAVRRLAIVPKVVRLLEQSYGRAPFAFQTLNFKRGTEQPTHADAIHFHSEPQRFMCGVWVALEDIHADAGPLAYRPGSHKLPVLTMRGAGIDHDPPVPDDYGRHYLPALDARLQAAGLPSATAVLRKGEALVWAANLAHGGAAIADPGRTRRSLVTHYFFKDCLYYTPMTSDVEGERFAARLPCNVATGFVEWPRRDGRRVKVEPSQLAGAALKILGRRPVY